VFRINDFSFPVYSHTLYTFLVSLYPCIPTFFFTIFLILLATFPPHPTYIKGLLRKDRQKEKELKGSHIFGNHKEDLMSTKMQNKPIYPVYPVNPVKKPNEANFKFLFRIFSLYPCILTFLFPTKQTQFYPFPCTFAFSPLPFSFFTKRTQFCRKPFKNSNFSKKVSKIHRLMIVIRRFKRYKEWC